MAADVVNTVSAMLEQVDPICRDIFESSDQVSAKFKKNAKNITNISRYLYRIPLKQYRGGTHSKYSANGGTLPTGSGMKLTSLQAGYIYTITMFRVTDEQVDLSQNTKQSVVDVMAQTLSDGMMEAAIADDQWLHTDGTGELTLPCASITGTNTMVFNGDTDSLGVSRLREGMAVDVWTYDGATKRAAGTLAPVKIETIDYNTNTVVFDQNVTSLSAGNGAGGTAGTGDMITFYGLDTYGPATLVSFSAGWPATSALTTSGGLTNDSGRHGLYYAHNFTSSNYYLGKLKSALPQIAPTSIDANKQALSFAHGFALQDKIRKRRSGAVAEKLQGIFPLSQRFKVFDIGVSLSTNMRTGAQFGPSVDMQPNNAKYTDTFNYCNMDCFVSKRQFNDRVDFCNITDNWGRAEVFPLRPYKKPNGDTSFEGRASTGALAAYTEFGFQAAYDFVCFDPGQEGAIINIDIPQLY